MAMFQADLGLSHEIDLKGDKIGNQRDVRSEGYASFHQHWGSGNSELATTTHRGFMPITATVPSSISLGWTE
ncbi:hypothetical protein DHEL01_v209646 [Diaporthe helianthi]|uniref:Uncharacterized protein n=1 Tax=Diaporthe helianthi TaxID=158607 RepID=A0A2P5HNZ4_DIAHE|nr:hypothetical protein DHEL01_v209646 [Diaporthe helianthi]